MMMLIYTLLVGVADLRAVSATENDEREAAAVFRAMHRDLEKCFERVGGSAFITVEAVIAQTGRVREVKTTGGARAGVVPMRCVERRVARAVFPVPKGGGTSRVRVGFAFTYD